jgi:hypothetical protein
MFQNINNPWKFLWVIFYLSDTLKGKKMVKPVTH